LCTPRALRFRLLTVIDEQGKVLTKAVSEGVAGMARLHELVGQHLREEAAEVAVGIETDRGPWVAGLIAAG
jgi:hypothetical protein